MRLKLSVENVYLAAVFSFLVFLGLGTLWNHQLKHDFPYGYFASDAFQHQTRAQGIKDAGNYKNEPFYIVFGIRNVVGYYPALIYHLSAILSYISGLEVYDTIYFLPFLFASLASIIFYFCIRKLSTNVAILSMPLAILLFYSGAYTGFTWGNWPSLLAQFFLIAFFWCLANIDIEKSFLFFAFFLSAIIMSHTSEAIFGSLIAMAYVLYLLIKKRLTKGIIRNIIVGLLLMLIISSYYLIIFKYIWMARQPYTLSVVKEWGAPTLYLKDLKLIIIILFGIGLISGIAMLIQLKNTNAFPFIISLLMLLFSYANYVGFGDRAFQIRYFWPIYISTLLGLSLYQIAKLIYKKWGITHSIVASSVIFLILAFSNLSFLPTYKKISSQGIMDGLHWSALNWLGKNTEGNAVIYFFYGDVYNQDAVLRNSKRAHKLIVPQDYVDAIQKKEVRRFYDTESPGDGGGGAAIRNGIFSFVFRLDEIEKELAGKKDICQYNYYVFDKKASQPVLAQYNLVIANEMLKRDFIKPVYDNEMSLVLKNNKPGGDCIEQRAFG